MRPLNPIYLIVFSIIFNFSLVDAPDSSAHASMADWPAAPPPEAKDTEMKTEKTDRHEVDEFEPIALGSVSEETKGGPDKGEESLIHPDTRVE
ncbi:MAG: hypothetical protein B7X53_00005 [Hyphomonas sp. 34-62-18]|nr:MAG: hypothetical protein B7X53_00005 [Hyphomonas sp. 34-62-18]